MLYTGVILIVAWLLGMGRMYDIGLFVHVFLVVGLLLISAGMLGARRVVLPRF